MPQRLPYIDYLKAFAIFLVVCYHSRYIPFDSTFIACAYSCCVPVFFMVNGFMMLRKERTISDLWKSNLKLILLTLIWSFILSASYMHITGEFVNSSLKDSLFLLTKHSLYFDQDYSNYLWFLLALIVLNAANPILYAFIHSRKNNIWYLVILLGITTIQIFDYLTNKYINPLMHYPYRYSLLYYVLGYALLSDDVLPEIKTRIRAYKYNKIYLWCGVVLAVLMQYIYVLILRGSLQPLNDAKGWVRPDLIGMIWNGYGAFFIVILTSFICLAFKYTFTPSNSRAFTPSFLHSFTPSFVHSFIRSFVNSFILYIGFISLPIYLIHPIFTNHVGHYLNQFDWYAANHYTHILLPIIALLFSIATAYALSKSRYTHWLITTKLTK